MAEAVLCGGFGGPEEGFDAAVDGSPGRFWEGDGVDGGVEAGFGTGVAECTALFVRVLESFLSAEDFENDAPGGTQTTWWQPSLRLGCGDQRLRFRSGLGSRRRCTFTSLG